LTRVFDGIGRTWDDGSGGSSSPGIQKGINGFPGSAVICTVSFWTAVFIGDLPILSPSKGYIGMWAKRENLREKDG
jgi:hypothetical protein